MDPWTLGLVVVPMLLLSAASAYFPARRASRIEPMPVLRLSRAAGRDHRGRIQRAVSTMFE